MTGWRGDLPAWGQAQGPLLDAASGPSELAYERTTNAPPNYRRRAEAVKVA